MLFRSIAGVGMTIGVKDDCNGDSIRDKDRIVEMRIRIVLEYLYDTHVVSMLGSVLSLD